MTHSFLEDFFSTSKPVRSFRNHVGAPPASIFFQWVDYIQEFFSGPAHRRNSVESSFQNSLRNFFRRLESHIAEAASWPQKGGDKHE